MIDIKQLTEKIQEQNGFCSLPNNSYASVRAIRYRLAYPDAKPLYERLRYRIDTYNGEPVIQFIGAVTGYEAFRVSDILQFPPTDVTYFSVCAGTPGVYDRLLVRSDDVMNIISNLRHNP